MIKYLSLLLICHLLGDFYFQTDYMAVNKKCLNKVMCIHSLIYVLPYLSLFIIHIPPSPLFLPVPLLAVTHLAVDCIFCRLKLKLPSNHLSLFVYDQALHILIVVMISFRYPVSIAIPLKYIVFILTVLLLLKPSGILVNLIFIWVFGSNITQIPERDRIGSRIGYFERTIIFLLCIFHSVSTIGFILTAKTLVRYEDIGKNENKFREKYLIGTLASSIMALVCYGLWKYVLLP